VYQLASDQNLMFWGGELTRKVDVLQGKRAGVLGHTMSVVRANRAQNSRVIGIEQPVLEVGITAGAPSRSRCGWCMLCVKGNGPLKRRMRTRGFIKSFFDNWDHLYASLDGESLFFFEARNAAEAMMIIPLSAVRSIHIDLMEVPAVELQAKKGKAMEDKFVMVITTHNRDIVMLK
jgi:hypothetical protein